ncbi:unnamed protein product [Peronospora effusa]|uniref:Uncharacterized protein n=1 Tax=Peronospora effusa TaxID=542832 RepID=A0A3M6VQZ4_9STRA|nr:hypothetical protein DD238_004085 [Peronospora effusa]RQM16086.1 hypothetical protein DD237_004547 [Peronospora effusa]CAI5702371.1 unnamed protein product [Peronospora effusa]
MDEILSSVPHQHSDAAAFTFDDLFSPPHQHSDAAVSTVPLQQFDAAAFNIDEHFLFPHQHSDPAVSTVPHQHSDAAVLTVDQFLAHHDDVKGQLDIVYEYAGATDARDRHAQWLEMNIHPTDVLERLKFIPGQDLLLVQIPTFRLIYYVDQYNEKKPLRRINLLEAFGIVGYDEEALIKSVFLPNMDKEVIAQTHGMVHHIGSRENFDKALRRLQQYAKTQITKDLIKSWLDQKRSVEAVMAHLGLSPKTPKTGYDFSRYKTLVMYEYTWHLRYGPKTYPILQVHTLMEQSGYTLEDFKILHEKSGQKSALSKVLAHWIQNQ